MSGSRRSRPLCGIERFAGVGYEAGLLTQGSLLFLSEGDSQGGDVVARRGAEFKSPAGAFQARHDRLELGLAQWSRAQNQRRRPPQVIMDESPARTIGPFSERGINLPHFGVATVAKSFADLQDVQLEQHEDVVVRLRLVTQHRRLFVPPEQGAQRLGLPEPELL